MGKIKIKEGLIGAVTDIKGLGPTKIEEKHAEILAQQGRFDIVDGVVPAKKLEPKKKVKVDKKKVIEPTESKDDSTND